MGSGTTSQGSTASPSTNPSSTDSLGNNANTRDPNAANQPSAVTPGYSGSPGATTDSTGRSGMTNAETTPGAAATGGSNNGSSSGNSMGSERPARADRN